VAGRYTRERVEMGNASDRTGGKIERRGTVSAKLLDEKRPVIS